MFFDTGAGDGQVSLGGAAPVTFGAVDAGLVSMDTAPPAAAAGGAAAEPAAAAVPAPDVPVPRRTFFITGWTTCSFFQKSKRALEGLKELSDFDLVVEEKEDRAAFREFWFERRKTLGNRAAAHNSSPAVWTKVGDEPEEFVGGCDDNKEFLRDHFLGGGHVAAAERVHHDNDVWDPNHGFDFDLVVIGGGSGGLAASKEAAGLGMNTCVLDFVKPSWQGTRWGLGGTCVNVGCIPKKLMHQAALLGEANADAPFFGWDAVPARGHDWTKLVDNVQDYIASLNAGYKTDLSDKSVTYKNALGRMVGPHEIELTNKQGTKSTITAARILVAVGGRPRPLTIPGGELAISSDDLFSLPRAPGKTLMIGAGYVSLECAGFLRSLGYDVSVCVRSILLRGFDRECVGMIEKEMREKGTRFLLRTLPERIEQLEDGKLRVHFKAAGDEADPDMPAYDDFDTVMTATGRVADTTALNLAEVGVETSPRNGKVICTQEQTSVPHIYAIGDVVDGAPELTPVAIQAGQLLAQRLFAHKTEGIDYEKVATAVFTPVEYGVIGLSEEAAIARYGADRVDVYTSYFTPLEWQLPTHRPKEAVFAKIIVDRSEDGLVLGFHYIGPHAGEITQGFSVGMHLGMRYRDLRKTIGIHPVIAEEFTLLHITKRSGQSSKKTGC